MTIKKHNIDKPHRCPECNAITDERKASNWQVVTCCTCHAQFTRYPWLAFLLPKAGVVCSIDHLEEA